MTSAAVVLVCASLSAAAPDPPVLLDRVVAVVDRRVVTASEVAIEARLQLLEKGGVGALEVTLDDRLLAKIADVIVLEEILTNAARKDPRFTVKESDIDRALAALRARIGDEDAATAALARLRADDDLLRARTRRQLLVAAYVAAALDAVSHPDAASLAAAAAAHPTVPGTQALIDVLRQERFDSLVAQARADVEVQWLTATAASPQ